MVNNVLLVLGVEQSDSVIHILMHASILFQILFSFRLLQNIEKSSCAISGSLLVSVLLNIEVCTCQSRTPRAVYLYGILFKKKKKLLEKVSYFSIVNIFYFCKAPIKPENDHIFHALITVLLTAETKETVIF